ncbi:uncharacterized protein BDZ83DRAFT_767064, partial [Colletotrichum acutatum]
CSFSRLSPTPLCAYLRIFLLSPNHVLFHPFTSFVRFIGPPKCALSRATSDDNRSSPTRPDINGQTKGHPCKPCETLRRPPRLRNGTEYGVVAACSAKLHLPSSYPLIDGHRHDILGALHHTKKSSPRALLSISQHYAYTNRIAFDSPRLAALSSAQAVCLPLSSITVVTGLFPLSSKRSEHVKHTKQRPECPWRTLDGLTLSMPVWSFPGLSTPTANRAIPHLIHLFSQSEPVISSPPFTDFSDVQCTDSSNSKVEKRTWSAVSRVGPLPSRPALSKFKR